MARELELASDLDGGRSQVRRVEERLQDLHSLPVTDSAEQTNDERGSVLMKVRTREEAYQAIAVRDAEFENSSHLLRENHT